MKMFLQSHVPWIYSVSYINCQKFNLFCGHYVATVNAVIETSVYSECNVSDRTFFFINDMYTIYWSILTSILLKCIKYHIHCVLHT